MSRFRRVLHGVTSSYLLLAAAAIYSLGSVPIALMYLDTKRFGLWVIMGTLAGYLSLIDVGMSAALARLLIDEKDNPHGGNYGSLIKTGWLVSIIQGFIVLLIGFCLASFFAKILAIPKSLQPEFIQLVYWQCAGTALSFATRMPGMLLYAHQRVELINYVSIGSLVVNFVSQWVFFQFGFGILSLAFGSGLAVITSVFILTIVCSFLKLYPNVSGRGRISWVQFRELFKYGRDVFLVNVGRQLIMASQTIVITRMLGLEAAATWGIGTRAYSLLNMIVWRVSDTAEIALAEMLVRREMDRLRDRYRSLVILSFSLAGWLAVSFAECNSPFISIWTRGRIHWSTHYDCLLALLMVLTAGLRCHTNALVATKEIGFLRFIYLIEGFIYVIMAFLLARVGGISAIIACSIICAAACSYSYSVWRVSLFLKLPVREIALKWLSPMGKMLLFFAPSAAFVWWISLGAGDLPRFLINALFAGSFGIYLFLRFGIPNQFQNELLSRMPPKAVPFLKRIP